MTYHRNEDGSSCWDESVCYRFEVAEIEEIRRATGVLYHMVERAVAHVIANPQLLVERFGIPESYVEYIRHSWSRRGDSYDLPLLTRLDLGYDPDTRAVKLIEFNGDAPLLLNEMVAQREWKEAFIPNAKQFNSIERKLGKVFDSLAIVKYFKDKALHFGAVRSEEEWRTLETLEGLAQRAGIRTKLIALDTDVSWNSAEGFIDKDYTQIENLLKMYPWDWIAEDEFGQYFPDGRTRVIEPVWKMIASSKALLPILWELFPGDPNLLPAFFPDATDHTLNETGNYFVKPINGRSGENIRAVHGHEIVEMTGGGYADLGVIYQGAATMPHFDGQTVLIGSWLVGPQQAGMIVREAPDLIVSDDAKVVPHYVVD